MELERVMVHQGWGMMEEDHLHLEEAEVVEQEELEMVRMMMLVDEGVMLAIFQVMDSLIIIGRDKEVLVVHIGIFNNPQNQLLMVVLVFLVVMVEVVVEDIVDHLMAMTGTV
jgi:hypothetical protein